MENRYGQLPKQISITKAYPKEMMFYQYYPIKLKRYSDIVIEPRLNCLKNIIELIKQDFICEFGIQAYINSNIYLTAKYMFQQKGCSYNREGYHSDGFLTDDINYIWSDCNGTTFNFSEFNLTLNDEVSLKEMEYQAKKENDIIYKDNSVIRLNQFNIHKVSEIEKEGMRAFLKISFSKDKYDLIGNSHNYLLDYDWEMKPRNIERNIPQSEM